jgi:hypothetical protein
MNNDISSRSYDPEAVLKWHERDVLAQLDRDFGPQWSVEKEEAYFEEAYRRLDHVVGGCDIRRRWLEEEGLRPMNLHERRRHENRLENNRRLKLAALDRKHELWLNPPMGEAPSCALDGARLRRVK